MAPGTQHLPHMHSAVPGGRSTKQVSPPTTPTSSLASASSAGSAVEHSLTSSCSSTSSTSSSSSTASTKPNFKDESDRLRSFGSWPSSAPISKEKVARAGFYYLGSGLDVACAYCKVEIRDWSFNDVAVRKHREMSPNCPYLLEQSQSTTVSLEQRMRDPERRAETFAQWPKPNIDPQRLVNAGFYYLKDGDKVRCAWCKGVIEHWSPDDVPFDEHASKFPRCPFVLNPPEYAMRGEDECGLRNMCSSNKDARPAYMGGVVPHTGPKHPSMVSSTKRLQTFTSQSWPSSVTVSPEQLVEAGFFFLGMHDYTKCFHCDGGLCNWETGDVPWIEHARWFPQCKFVLLNKGEAFIRECQQVHQELISEVNVAAAQQPPDTNLPEHLRSELETIMASSDVEFYISQGVPQQVVRMTLKKFMMDNQRGFCSQEELAKLLGQVLNFSPRATTELNAQTKVGRSSEDIPENVVCRVCMAQERCIVFLPCGHLATCAACAASVTECVMCRAPIQGTLRTFLS